MNAADAVLFAAAILLVGAAGFRLGEWLVGRPGRKRF